VRARVAARLDERGAYPRWVLWVALTGMFATTFPITVLTLAIPAMARDFDVPETTLAWVIILPTILSALALPVLGKLGDLYGHRRVFIVGFLVATVATGLTATAWSAVTLIAWRTATQVVGAATQPSSLALINASYPPEQRSKAMGWWAMVAAGAPVIGLVIGGPLIDAMGWQVLFLLQAALMVVPVAASWVILRETPRRSARFDLAGAATLAVGVGALMVALSRGPEWGITSIPVLAALVVAPLALASFVRAERRATSPLLPLDFFGRKDFSAPVLVSFFSSGAYMGGYFLATLMVLRQFGYSESGAVAILAIRPLLFALSSPPGGWLAFRIGNRNSAVLGCLVLAGGLGGLSLGAGIESLVVVVAVGFVLQGIGYGLLRPPVSTALANAVDNEDLGIAGASERLMGQIGFAFGVTLLTTVYADTPTPERFSLGFAVGAALALLAALCASMMRPGRVADQQIGSGTDTLVLGSGEEGAEEEAADGVRLDRAGTPGRGVLARWHDRAG
jgi:MFS family permease